jgi:subtilisin family serine protease
MDAGAGAAATREFNVGGAARQLDMLHIPEAHAMGYHGEGVLVAVLDSGFDLTHEAFASLQVRAQHDFVNDDEDASYDPRTDRPGQANHGSQVLSILAGYAPGHLLGPAHAADFLLARTEQIAFERPIEEDWWVAGVEWAERLGADIVSSSVSYSKFYRWRDMDGRHGVATRAADLAFERGLIVVESVGNQGPREGNLGSPADAVGAISVGAVDTNGQIAPFSTAGPTWDLRVKPDVCAMGVQVEHAVAGARDRYGRGSGTSYATPLVAGCVALVLQAHPDWGPESVREALLMSADRAAAPDNRYGWGLVNVRDAILYPQIEGHVADASTREPIAGARVSWEPSGSVDSTGAAPSDAPPRGITRTDSTGAYVVPNLPRGTYRLRVAADGHFEATSEPIQVPPGIGDVNFQLRYRGE